MATVEVEPQLSTVRVYDSSMNGTRDSNSMQRQKVFYFAEAQNAAVSHYQDRDAPVSSQAPFTAH